ncbi:hypothetical protein C8Q73DRAFT_663359 [Cubamyces lactineus]|nr:hypothetical protein C8Q73DRAFT_663359 [Cubamyces lactineus]
MACYCKKAHQLRDKIRHDTECYGGPSTDSPSPEARTTRPPGVRTRMLKVLLFPPDEDAPRVVETECEVYTDDSINQGEERHKIRIGTTLLDTSTVTAIPIGPIAFPQSNNIGAPPTRLYLAFDASIQGHSPSGPRPLNRAALGITDDGQPHKPWRGALVGFRAREPVRTTRQFVDVDLQDLPAFAAGLNSRALAPYFLTWDEMPPDEVLEDIVMRVLMEALARSRDAETSQARAASSTAGGGSRGSGGTPDDGPRPQTIPSSSVC